ncbi:TDP-N-acetylfucosamine:lipid II N-acetylfucosaminyltransferase [Pedobacter gandavensis]|uniref:TDP-N-acetylfucosamine:lipid II N-acetylfucosaminyltransferase n=1 Tax=Pedobacter gandavensis TaxID=2679963 RepID=UPI0029310DF0|nr:TDP-N-acetylfucosamine:lipid II N-acetylfucosaminyltransferase [Pedobacter gandavensis]
MNYHLMIDDKFINDFIIDAEAAAPNQNVFIIDAGPHQIRHVKSDLAIFAPYHSPLFLETIKNIQENDQVFIHWASDAAINFVLQLPEKIKTGLFFWGGDIVEIPYSIYKKDIYGRLSLRYFEKYEERPKVKWNPLKPKRLFRTLSNRYWKYKANEQKVLETRIAFFARLNYFFNWNILDFDWILKNYQTIAVYKYFFYNFNPVPAQELVAKAKIKQEYTTILIGNSDTTTNNHMEILETLKKFKSEAIKLVIPLNYGNKKYGDLIEKRAVEIFGRDKVIALRNFMDRDAYYSILDNVDLAVMNHYRTQAAGNTLALLYRGKKVFIHERSSTYQLLNTNNVQVGNSATIAEMSFHEFSSVPTADSIQHNIKAIDQLFRIEEKKAVLKDALA